MGEQSAVLLVSRHVAELGPGPEFFEQPGRPFRQLARVGVLQRVLELRAAHPVLDGEVLHGLHVERDAVDRLELTPRGSRRIGQNVLDDLFSRLSRDAFGGHRIDRAGRGGEREETTKPYEFGDPFHLDIRRHDRERTSPARECPEPPADRGGRPGG